MKKIITFILFVIVLWFTFQNTYANNYPIETWKLKHCNLYQSTNKDIFPCANNPYTYNILYWYYNPNWLNGFTIELANVYNKTDLFGYDNPILATNLITTIWFVREWINTTNVKFTKKYAWFNYQFLKKVLYKVRHIKSQKGKIKFLTILKNKINRVYNIIIKRYDKYAWKMWYEKQAEKYYIYEEIVWGLKYSIEALLYYDNHNMVNKYLKNTYWRNRIKNYGKPFSVIDERREEKQAEIRSEQAIIRENSLKGIENKFNCHWFKLPKKVDNDVRQLKNYTKYIWLAVCIMEKWWLPKDIWNMFLDDYTYSLDTKFSDDGWYTFITIYTFNNGYSKLLIPKKVYISSEHTQYEREKIVTFIHELTHNINYIALKKWKLANLNKFFTSAWNFKPYNKIEHNKSFYYRYIQNTKKSTIKNASCMFRDYSKTDILEDFATYWEYYFYYRHLASKNNPNTYKPYTNCMKQREQYFKAVLNDIK